MAPPAMCWCGHCGAVRRLRSEGEFASCASCGRVLLDLQEHAVAAPSPRQLRRQRRAHDGAVGRDVGAKSDVVVMAPPAMCWCGHCGAVRRLRAEGEFASCASCGRVLPDLQEHAVAAPSPRQLRRQRRAHDGAVGRDVGAKLQRGDISDAESTVTSTEDRWIEKK